MTAQKDEETEHYAAAMAPVPEAFKYEYEDALGASGLVDGVGGWSTLDPLPHRIFEGEYLCHRGDAADRLWVVATGSIAVRSDGKTLYVRRKNEVVGEQGILSDKGYRFYDLVANESQVQLFTIHRDRITGHDDADKIWRNIAKILSLKLNAATGNMAFLQDQAQSDARILRAYTNEYALSRRLQSGGRFLTDHRVDTAVIWFSDVSDFSGIVLKLSPVRAADLIQQFFNVQAEAIHHHGGHIDKFMGDGLMAFWILPQDTSAARQRICEEVADAAMAAATAVGELHLGARALKLRIGLHVGQVLSGDFGSATRHQFTLIGAEVNKAARLEQATSDDLVEKNMKISNVRVSEGYYSALSDPYKARFPNKACLRARNIGDLALYS